MQTVECILLNLKNRTRFRMCSFTRIHRKTSVPESFLIFSFNFFFNRFLFLFLLKKTLAHVFSCEFCGILKITFFTEHLRAIASGRTNKKRPIH